MRYGKTTGDFPGIFETIGRAVIAYIPGLTFVDKGGLVRFAQERMVDEFKTVVQKQCGILEPKLSDF